MGDTQDERVLVGQKAKNCLVKAQRRVTMCINKKQLLIIGLLCVSNEMVGICHCFSSHEPQKIFQQQKRPVPVVVPEPPAEPIHVPEIQPEAPPQPSVDEVPAAMDKAVEVVPVVELHSTPTIADKPAIEIPHDVVMQLNAAELILEEDLALTSSRVLARVQPTTNKRQTTLDGKKVALVTGAVAVTAAILYKLFAPPNYILDELRAIRAALDARK